MIPQDLILERINALPPEKIDEVIDFIDFLAERELSAKKAERFRLISEYAAENAQTEFDFDENLEKAGIENLLTIDEAAK